MRVQLIFARFPQAEFVQHEWSGCVEYELTLAYTRNPAQLRQNLASEISDLVRAHGITRDQARRLINRMGTNRTKLDQAATILKGRLSPRPARTQNGKPGASSDQNDDSHLGPARTTGLSHG